jgi:hypothetical protein
MNLIGWPHGVLSAAAVTSQPRWSLKGSAMGLHHCLDTHAHASMHMQVHLHANAHARHQKREQWWRHVPVHWVRAVRACSQTSFFTATSNGPHRRARSQHVTCLVHSAGVFDNALKDGVRNLNFGGLSTQLGTTMYQYKFRIPSYFTLLVRRHALPLSGLMHARPSLAARRPQHLFSCFVTACELLLQAVISVASQPVHCRGAMRSRYGCSRSLY